ncbi:MAG: hypothetical protein ACYCU7_15420 [Acidimicrobiales bacterium]
MDDEAVDEGLGGRFAPGVGAVLDELLELGAQGVEVGLGGRVHGGDVGGVVELVAPVGSTYSVSVLTWTFGDLSGRSTTIGTTRVSDRRVARPWCDRGAFP